MKAAASGPAFAHKNIKSHNNILTRFFHENTIYCVRRGKNNIYS